MRPTSPTTRGRGAAAAVALALSAGLLAQACSGSRRGFFGDPDVQDAMTVYAATRAIDAAAALAVEAALARMDPAFPGLTPRPNVSASGTSTQGDVRLDLGSASSSGTPFAGVTLRGEVTATYARSANQATVAIALGALTAEADDLRFADVGGSLSATVTFSGASATVVVTGQATLATNEVIVVTPNVTFGVTAAGAAATAVSSNQHTVSSGLRGQWTVALGTLSSQVEPQPRTTNTGTVGLTRTSGRGVTVTLIFTAPDRGTLTVSTSGVQESFRL